MVKLQFKACLIHFIKKEIGREVILSREFCSSMELILRQFIYTTVNVALQNKDENLLTTLKSIFSLYLAHTLHLTARRKIVYHEYEFYFKTRSLKKYLSSKGFSESCILYFAGFLEKVVELLLPMGSHKIIGPNDLYNKVVSKNTLTSFLNALGISVGLRQAFDGCEA